MVDKSDVFMWSLLLFLVTVALTAMFIETKTANRIYRNACRDRCAERNSGVVAHSDTYGCVCSDATMWHAVPQELWQPGAPE